MPDSIRILVVEDDAIDRIAFERFVRDEKIPYNYVLAPSIAIAHDLLSRETFDAIVTDHHLGDGTAFDILNKAGTTPTIVVTGSTEQNTAALTMKMGARGYLIKDYDRHYLKILPATVNNAIERSIIEKEREQLIVELQDALAHIKTLRGLLPICAACKKIRDDEGYWHRMESYLGSHSEVEFTHGLCPDCAEKTLEEAGLSKQETNT